MYRRRKRLRHEAERSRIQVSEEAPPLPDNDRQGSLSSVVRVQTLAKEDEMIEKYGPVFILDGFHFHSDEGYQPTGTGAAVEPKELPSELRSPCERCDRGREPRVQFQGNSFEQDENIGQAR
jgi:hypothetical protein